MIVGGGVVGGAVVGGAVGWRRGGGRRRGGRRGGRRRRGWRRGGRRRRGRRGLGRRSAPPSCGLGVALGVDLAGLRPGVDGGACAGAVGVIEIGAVHDTVYFAGLEAAATGLVTTSTASPDAGSAGGVIVSGGRVFVPGRLKRHRARGGILPVGQRPVIADRLRLLGLDRADGGQARRRRRAREHRLRLRLHRRRQSDAAVGRAAQQPVGGLVGGLATGGEHLDLGPPRARSCWP